MSAGAAQNVVVINQLARDWSSPAGGTTTSAHGFEK